MGSGKSTLARMLAKKTDRYYLDTDQLIENYLDFPISKVFEHYGEEFFRQEEQRVVKWLESAVSNAVIATGGGMPTVCNSLQNLGKVVYIKLGFEEIYKRLSDDSERTKRPLATSYDDLLSRYNERQQIYSSYAKIIIDATGKTKEELCKTALEAI